MRSFLFTVRLQENLITKMLDADRLQLVTDVRGKTAVLYLGLKTKSLDEAQRIADDLNENVAAVFVGVRNEVEPGDEWVN